MLKLGHISQQQYDEAVNAEQDAKLHIKTPDVYAPYVAEMVRLEMINRYGSDAYTNGLNVYTTVPSSLQNHAQNAVFSGLTDYDRRHGYRGPEAHIEKRSEWQNVLRNTRRINRFIPAIVSAIADDGIFVMLSDGSEEHVSWQTMRWAPLSSATPAVAPHPATRRPWSRWGT